MLVMDDGPLRGGDQLREKLVGLGAEVEWTRHSGQKFLLMVPHRATLPDGSINLIVTWLGTVPADETIESSAPPSTAFTERPVRFGGDPEVFGIMVPPAPGARVTRPAVLLLNAGCVNRTGPHRLYVTMARRLAALGFPVLRVDLAGIGDTPASPNTPENLVYPRDGLAEIGLALDFLQAETGTDRFVVVGLCSGADLAFQAARRGRRLEGVVMMNPRTFLELDLGRVESPTAQSAASDDAAIAEALRVTAGLGEISRRGTDALLVVSRPDPGIDFVDRHAAGAMREAEELPCFRRIDVPGTDHTFTTLASQRRVLDVVTDQLLAHDRAAD
jgi:dienelactone hydrolase